VVEEKKYKKGSSGSQKTIQENKEFHGIMQNPRKNLT
jgi:hypothetical protein